MKFVILLILALVCFIPLYAEAAPAKKIVGIVIEKSCLLSDKCLGYSDILYLDRSNRIISGDFIAEGDDVTRKCSKYQNNISWYSFNHAKNVTIIVDPCFNQRTYIPIITIVSKLEFYKGFDQKEVKEVLKGDAKPTQTRLVSSHTRYVNDQCNEAVIGYGPNWKSLLHDTINYLNSGCDPAHTKINTIKETITPLTKHDIPTSAKYKLDKFYDYIKKNCSQKRNACTEIDNKAVTTNGDSK